MNEKIEKMKYLHSNYGTINLPCADDCDYCFLLGEIDRLSGQSGCCIQCEQKQREIEVLQTRVMRLVVQTPEEQRLTMTNAGAIGLAEQLLKDDGRGQMSPGPCADAQKLVRELKAQVKELKEENEAFARTIKAFNKVEILPRSVHEKIKALEAREKESKEQIFHLEGLLEKAGFKMSEYCACSLRDMVIYLGKVEGNFCGLCKKYCCEECEKNKSEERV